MREISTEGIMRGPYPGLTQEQVEKYVVERIGHEVDADTIRVLSDDAQSHYQYEQHCFAVQDAIAAGRIEQGMGLFVMSKILQPWAKDVRAIYYHRFQDTK